MEENEASLAGDDAKEVSASPWTSDEEFGAWLSAELHKDPLSADYPEMFELAPRCMVQWRQRFRGDPVLWKRLFCKDRVMKEFIEAVPIIDAVYRLVQDYTGAKKLTICDLASGRGYLSMLLSEMLDPTKVEKFVLIDKAWSQRNMEPQSHHIKWDHIYGDIPNKSTGDDDDGEEEEEEEEEGNNDVSLSSFVKKKKKNASYYDTWPIPLETSKQDLKSAHQRERLQDRFFRVNEYYPNRGPVILLAVHLCGTLSLKAVEFFNANSNIHFFCLKPCCLPGMIHAKRHEIFCLGRHEFAAQDVCMAGKWKKNQWHGPARTHLQSYFQNWADNLFLGIQSSGSSSSPQEDESGSGGGDEAAPRKIQTTVRVQHDGGYQNEFLFAQRQPVTDSVWERLALS